MKHILSVETILYVKDQQKSTDFYKKILRKLPDLNVPGMTEFQFSENFKLGLMPETGIAKIVCPPMPLPESGNGIPRCELYFYVEEVEQEFENAVASGAKLISEIQDRDWGDQVCYFADLDGHILAFAKRIDNKI